MPRAEIYIKKTRPNQFESISIQHFNCSAITKLHVDAAADKKVPQPRYSMHLHTSKTKPEMGIALNYAREIVIRWELGSPAIDLLREFCAGFVFFLILFFVFDVRFSVFFCSPFRTFFR